MYIKQNSQLSHPNSKHSFICLLLSSFHVWGVCRYDPLTSYQKHCTPATGVNITERTWPLALLDFYLIDINIWQLYAATHSKFMFNNTTVSNDCFTEPTFFIEDYAKYYVHQSFRKTEVPLFLTPSCEKITLSLSYYPLSLTIVDSLSHSSCSQLIVLNKSLVIVCL